MAIIVLDKNLKLLIKMKTQNFKLLEAETLRTVEGGLGVPGALGLAATLWGAWYGAWYAIGEAYGNYTK